MGTKKEQAEAQAPARVAKGTAVAKADEFDDLSRLAVEGKQFEDEERARTGSSLTWVTCVQPGVGLITKGDDAYVKGVEAGDFFLNDRKLHIGETLRGNLLGAFKVYAEQKKKESASEMAQTVKFWHPDDADQIPLEGNFERPLANGNVLVPMHWVFLEIEGHEDILDVMLPFRSKGNSYFVAFEKLVKKSSDLCAQLKVEFKAEAVKNEEFKKTYFYPVGSIVGKNFDFDAETGKVSLIKGAADAKSVRRILEKYNELQKRYKESKIVSKLAPSQLAQMIPGNSVRRAGLPAGSGTGEYTSDASDEVQRF